ncbi:MAG: M23 family metallopeptidase [Granulosicoccus sp.]
MIASSSQSLSRVPPQALLRLPVGMRLRLARFAVWRMRHRGALKTTMLALCLAALSGALGYLLSQSAPIIDAPQQPPQVGAALPSTYAADDQVPVEAQQWGQLQAELLRLRLLFKRIVDAADLEGGEFALELQLADERYLASLSPLQGDQQVARQRFVLAKHAVDHMTTQAEMMLSIKRQRQQARSFTLSGSPVVRAQITSRFGYRIDPRSGRRSFHSGVDFGGKNGSKVFALADGVVTYSGKNGGYGNLIELEHPDGFSTRYAHNEANLVAVGSRVNKGQIIATMGSTGKSTGTHVHIEVRAGGRPVDPLEFISAGS